MFITTQNEIISLMPTARWDRPQQLFGYLEEEERVALEPLLGTALYSHLCTEYVRLRETLEDITATTVRPTGQAKQDPKLAYTDVTERLEQIQAGTFCTPYSPADDGDMSVTPEDMAAIRLIRICQQIEFYRMLAHKAGLLTVSFNEGGGMNVVGNGDYDPVDDKRMQHVVKDAFMSAGRATDNLLLFLEADAKGERLFTDLWQQADAYYLHKDLLFQTARVLNEYLDIKGERMAYVALVRDIRFCQNTYLKPRIGATLLKQVVKFAAEELDTEEENAVYGELLDLLRTALAFYVESRRTELGPANDKLARRDSMTDAQQAMADACAFIEQNLEALGDAAVNTPIYIKVKQAEAVAERNTKCACAARERLKDQQGSRRLFTAFPPTHRLPETK